MVLRSKGFICDIDISIFNYNIIIIVYFSLLFYAVNVTFIIRNGEHV